MTDAQQALWTKIEGFSFDSPEAAGAFLKRVVSDQSWPEPFARRVVEEYRRFAFIAATSGHPVSPSAPVDEVWHQHLQFTRSYWNDFCRGTLGFSLHHEPGVGRPGEADQHARWYEQTLASYRALFHEEPPLDIWPPPFAPGRARTIFLRIDPRRYWLIQRPAWWGARPLAAAAMTLMAGCFPLLVGWTNPFDLRGPEFLQFYILVTPFFFALAVLVRWAMRSGTPATVQNFHDHVYGCALLAGGIHRATDAVVSALYCKQLIAIDVNKKTVRAVDSGGDGSSPVEAAMLALIREHNPVGMATLRKAASPVFSDLLEKLRAAGLWLPPGRARRIQLTTWSLAGAPILIGAAKICIGVMRDRPVAILIFLTLAYAFAALAVFGRKPGATRTGNQWLREMAERHAYLKRRPAGPTPGPALAQDVSLAIGLYGISAANALGVEPLQSIVSHGPGGGCAGSSGGCGGGGGGGGGGCGGCGGGGH